MIDYLEDIKKLISKQFGITEDDIEEDSFLEADLNITDLDLEDLWKVFRINTRSRSPLKKSQLLKKFLT